MIVLGKINEKQLDRIAFVAIEDFIHAKVL
jgi:hypothetical protein